MESPILNPEIPYVGEIPGGLRPGKMVKIQGSTPPSAVRFAINYQLGPNLNPRDDIAIHLSPRFPEGFITRNHISSMTWGPEENAGSMWIQPGQEFEIIILCEPLQYKIAVNGRHFTEFNHRLSYQKVTHLVIDGDVEIKSINWESIGGPPKPSGDAPPVNIGAPEPGRLYPNLNPDQPQFPPAGGNWGPPPGPGGPPPQGYGYNWPDGGQRQPYKQEEEENAFGSCLDKVGLAVGGLVAAGGVAAVMHALNKKKEDGIADHEKEEHEKTHSSKTESEGGLNLGALGAALASGLASSALRGDSGLGHQQGYPSQDSSGAGGMLGSLLGALGGAGAGGGHQPSYPSQQPADPLGGLGGLGSILGGVLGGGGGGGHQPSGGYGGYQPSGGYGAPQQPQHGGGGNDFLSGIGGAIGSSLFSSALDGLTKHKSHGDDHPSSPPSTQNYGPPRHDPPPPPPSSRTHDPPPSSGGKLTAADISKGLGLGDDDE